MGRAPCCDKANVKKGPWSAEEDAKLRDFIGKFGTGGNWISLPQKAGLRRCGKSCRLRWLNYLRPNIKHGEFCEEEDRIICSLYASIGSRWSIIASHLPGRTDNDIKNYWNTKLKKKLMLINQRKIPQPFHNSPQPTSQIQGHSTMMPNLSQLLSDFTPFTPPGAGRYTNLPSPGFESSQPLSPNFLFNNTPDNLTSLNQYYGIEMQDGVMSNLGRYLNNNKMVMFGSNNNEAASCSSSDGSYCSQMSFGNIKEIKQESMSYVHHQLQPSTNGYEDEQKLILDYGSSTYTDNVVSGGYFGNPNHALLFEGYYDNVEEVKELISNNNNNNNNGSLYLNNDENKTYQRTMYFD